MADRQFEQLSEEEEHLGRRELLRRAALLVAGAAAGPLLAACDLASPMPTPGMSPTTAAGPSNGARPTVTATRSSQTWPAGAPTEQYTATALPPVAQVPTEPPPTEQPPTAPPPTEQLPTATQAPPSPTEPPPPTATSAPPKPTSTATPAAAAALGAHGVALLASTDRSAAVPAVLDMLGFEPNWLKGKNVALKANFNSADPPPGSTNLDTLRALVQQLQKWGAAKITLLERSGMGDTHTVLKQRGVTSLANEMGINVVVLDDLPASGWVKHTGAHWQRGFLFPAIVQEADAVVTTCCLKTHRFGGHFTMSLKNSVGLVAKYDPSTGYNYMGELHSSPNQRLMIAEVNAAYRPALVLLDGVLAFVNGGPDQGKKVQAGMFLAGRDRVALDAVAVAMLRHLGTTPEVSQGAIFDQPQISHAAALGLGASSPKAVSIVPADDDASKQMAGTLHKLLTA